MSHEETTGRAPARTPLWRDSMALLIVGIFALVLGGNAVMIWIAVGASPHLVAVDYYERSKRVDAELAAREASARLGWQVEELVALRERVVLHIRDRAGRPVSGLRGRVEAYRPSDAALDQRLAWSEDGAPGRYEARFGRPAAGLWRIRLDLQRGGQRLYEELAFVAP